MSVIVDPRTRTVGLNGPVPTNASAPARNRYAALNEIEVPTEEPERKRKLNFRVSFEKDSGDLVFRVNINDWELFSAYNAELDAKGTVLPFDRNGAGNVYVNEGPDGRSPLDLTETLKNHRGWKEYWAEQGIPPQQYTLYGGAVIWNVPDAKYHREPRKKKA